MRPRRLGSALLVWALAALSACSVPEAAEGETFLRRDQAREGVYVFPLTLTDTTAAYDFWFYSRSERRAVDNLRLDVRWTAPSGDSFTETVYMRRVTPGGTRELYRSGMVPAQAGSWRLSVRPAEAEEILGLGLISRRSDGTR